MENCKSKNWKNKIEITFTEVNFEAMSSYCWRGCLSTLWLWFYHLDDIPKTHKIWQQSVQIKSDRRQTNRQTHRRKREIYFSFLAYPQEVKVKLVLSLLKCRWLPNLSSIYLFPQVCLPNVHLYKLHFRKQKYLLLQKWQTNTIWKYSEQKKKLTHAIYAKFKVF